MVCSASTFTGYRAAENWLTVLNVDGGNDYCLRELTREPLFITPLKGSRDKLDVLYERLSSGTGKELKHEIIVFDRKIRAIRHSPGAIWFDFMEICGGRARRPIIWKSPANTRRCLFQCTQAGSASIQRGAPFYLAGGCIL